MATPPAGLLSQRGLSRDGAYREFHRDLGWHLPERFSQQPGDPLQPPSGPQLACGCDRPGFSRWISSSPMAGTGGKPGGLKHAADHQRAGSLSMQAAEEVMTVRRCLCPVRWAELFGPLVYEGPTFLAEGFSQGAAGGGSAAPA